MARLRLCFSPEETGRRRPLTQSEIDGITIAAQSITAIVKVMQEYTCDIQKENARDAVANCVDVFTVLECLSGP
jgi:hypothetical protein